MIAKFDDMEVSIVHKVIQPTPQTTPTSRQPMKLSSIVGWSIDLVLNLLCFGVSSITGIVG